MSVASNTKVVELKAYKRVAGKPDIRRFVLDATSEMPYGELIGKLARAYKEDPAQLLVHWKDSEGEYVSVENDEDFQVAMGVANGTLLKVFVTNTGKHVLDDFGEAVAAKSDGASDSTKQAEAGVRGGVHHPNVTCDGCNSGIYGRRFKCLECADYDLCERCELVYNRHPEHNMVLIRRPSSTGCPFMFAGRNRAFRGPPPYPGCPTFAGRGSRCGRFWHEKQQQGTTEAPSAEHEPNMDTMGMRFADMLRDAQNGQLPAVIAAVNEVLRPLGADLSVQVDAPEVERRDTATATEKGSTCSADSSEQAGTPLVCITEQAIQIRPSTCTAAVETTPVATNDKPTQSTESQSTAHVSVTGPLRDALQQLLDMGFDNSGGWLERLVVTKKGNIPEILDLLTNKHC